MDYAPGGTHRHPTVQGQYQQGFDYRTRELRLFGRQLYFASDTQTGAGRRSQRTHTVPLPWGVRLQLHVPYAEARQW